MDGEWSRKKNRNEKNHPNQTGLSRIVQQAIYSIHGVYECFFYSWLILFLSFSLPLSIRLCTGISLPNERRRRWLLCVCVFLPISIHSDSPYFVWRIAVDHTKHNNHRCRSSPPGIRQCRPIHIHIIALKKNKMCWSLLLLLLFFVLYHYGQKSFWFECVWSCYVFVRFSYHSAMHFISPYTCTMERANVSSYASLSRVIANQTDECCGWHADIDRKYVDKHTYGAHIIHALKPTCTVRARRDDNDSIAAFRRIVSTVNMQILSPQLYIHTIPFHS